MALTRNSTEHADPWSLAHHLDLPWQLWHSGYRARFTCALRRELVGLDFAWGIPWRLEIVRYIDRDAILWPVGPRRSTYRDTGVYDYSFVEYRTSTVLVGTGALQFGPVCIYCSHWFSESVTGPVGRWLPFQFWTLAQFCASFTMIDLLMKFSGEHRPFSAQT